MSTDPSRSPARTLVPARASGRGWKMPTAGEVATIRPSSRTACSRGRRAGPAVAPVTAVAPGPTGVRPAWCACRCAAAPDAPVGRARRAAGRGPRPARVPSAGPAQPDAPGTLADLELAETGRPELGDEGGQQLVAQAVDGGVVGRALGGACAPGRRASGWDDSGTR